MRMIDDGVVERDGVSGLSARLGYSERHLTPAMQAELGAGPLAIARARRAQTARLLIETTALPFSEVAFAAGFASIRQFNGTVQRGVRADPDRAAPAGGARRAAGRARGPAPAPAVSAAARVRTAARLPRGHRRARPGGMARRRLPPRAAAAARQRGRVRSPRATSTSTPGWRSTTCATSASRSPLPADARPRRRSDRDRRRSSAATRTSRRSWPRRPGVRLPGAADPAEFAVRAVVGQQVSTAAARTVPAASSPPSASPLDDPARRRSHDRLPRRRRALAEAPDAALPMPASRRRALRGSRRAVAGGRAVARARRRPRRGARATGGAPRHRARGPPPT